MKRIRSIMFCGIFIAALLIFALSLPVYSSIDCIGLSDCDFNPQRACMDASEFNFEDMLWARCEYSSCVTKYRVHCIDMDNDEPYTEYLICEDFRNPFCEGGGGEPPE